MLPKWRIEVRMGESAESPPIRSVVVEAHDEAEALRRALEGAEKDLAAAAEMLEDGQEEVFSRTEVETGHIEHSHDTR